MREGRFNINFVLLLVVTGLLGGCQSSSKKEADEEATTLRFFLETNPDPLGRTTTATIGGAEQFELTIEQTPFLTEIFVIEAELVQELGGFGIKLQFDRQGKWLLEQYTLAYKGRHFAIFSQFGEARWLAAPLVTRGIHDGVFVFTPLATQEEAERIVRGLKNVASQVKKENR